MPPPSPRTTGIPSYVVNSRYEISGMGGKTWGRGGLGGQRKDCRIKAFQKYIDISKLILSQIIFIVALKVLQVDICNAGLDTG